MKNYETISNANLYVFPPQFHTKCKSHVFSGDT